jgi:hypothetical protein
VLGFARVLAIVRPPRSLIRLMPIAPSPSAPEGTTPPRAGRSVGEGAEEQVDGDATAAVGAQVGAREVAVGGLQRLAGWDDVDVVGLDLDRSCTCSTGIDVERCRLREELSCSLDRCMTTTNTMPVSPAPPAKPCNAAMRRPAAEADHRHGRKARVGTGSSVTSASSSSAYSGASSARAPSRLDD